MPATLLVFVFVFVFVVVPTGPWTRGCAQAVGIPDVLKGTKIVQGEDASTLDAATVAQVVAAVEGKFTVPSELPLHKGQSPKQSFASILRRMRHQKMSSLLVPLAGEAAAQGDADLFGLLLDLEGQSLRMSGDFMITGDNGAQDVRSNCRARAQPAAVPLSHGCFLGVFFVVVGPHPLSLVVCDRVSSISSVSPGHGVAVVGVL